MSVKSTGIRWNPYYSCSRALTSRSSGLPVLLWVILLSTVCLFFSFFFSLVFFVSSTQTLEADHILFLAENKVSIVMLGGLAPLIRQMMSTNVEVQCNAVGCITNLATHEENKAKIAGSGALGPLTRLARSKDMRVQRNATGALLNMTHSGTYPCQHLRVCSPTNVLS